MSRLGDRPTLKHVADLCGVSEISVSRVMRNAPNVSPRLRERVMAAAATLGYVPNRIAGALASNATALVAVVVPSMTHSVFPEVLDGLDAVLSARGYSTVLGISHYDLAREEDLVAQLLAWTPAGIVVSGFEHSDRTRAMLTATAAAVVEIMDADGDPIGRSVGVSHAGSGRLMAQHLHLRGRRRIGYIGAWAERPVRSRKRRMAFEAELALLGAPLEALRIEEAPSSVVLGRDATAALLAGHPDLDAIHYANDDLAVGGLLHCLASGIDVPGRLALAGFNGIDMIGAMPMRLTTIATPRYRMGEIAARAVVDGDSFGQTTRIVLDAELLQGDTT